MKLTRGQIQVQVLLLVLFKMQKKLTSFLYIVTLICLICLLRFFIGTAGATTNGSEFKFKIREFAGIDRKEWPVTGGIPFARGSLLHSNDVEILDESQEAAKYQREVLARWDDGSIKWLLVDLFSSVEAHGERTYSVHIGRNQGRKLKISSPLKWFMTDNGIFIDTGSLRAEVSQRLFESLSIKSETGKWINLQKEAGQMFLNVNSEFSGYYYAGKPEISVEQRGLNRIGIKLSGGYYNKQGQHFGSYVIRVHAYSGKAYLKISHTFINTDFPERGLVTGIGLNLPIELNSKRQISYGDTFRDINCDWPSWVAQYDTDYQEISHCGETQKFKAKATGLFAIRGKNSSVAFFVPYWQELFPKKMELDGNGMTLWLWPPAYGALDLRREEQKQSEGWLEFQRTHPRLFRKWNDPGTARSAGISAGRYRRALRQQDRKLMARASAFGLARTHEFWFLAVPKAVDDFELKQFSAACREPLIPYVDPMYFDKTEVLGRFGWQDSGSFPEVENYLLRKLDWIDRHQNEWSKWWGFIDWGGLRSIYEKYGQTVNPGRWFKYLGRHGWRNSEVDIPLHFMYAYLRAGDSRAWHLFESTVRHQMDVDTIHFNLAEFELPDHVWHQWEWTRGGQHRHSYNHYSGGADPGHTWNESITNFYFLTGDRRAYDVALEIGEYSIGSPFGQEWNWFEEYSRRAKQSLRFGRNAANLYRNLLKCYEMTGDEKWLFEVKKWRNLFLTNRTRYLDAQASTFQITNYLIWTFALDYYMFKDIAIKGEILRIADWQLRLMKSGQDDRGLQYSYLASAIAWWITGDEDYIRWPWHLYLQKCRSLTPKAQGPGDFSRGAFYEIGQLAFFLRAGHGAGYNESKPPEALLPTPP
jgi:hypothetical protein